MHGPGPWIFASTYLIAAALIAQLVAASRRARNPRPSLPAARAAAAPGNGLLDAAYLAGGPRRVAHTALVAMQRDGRLHISRSGAVTRAPGAPCNAVEGQIVGALGRGHVDTSERLCRRVMASSAVRDLGTDLVRLGLLVDPVLRTRLMRRRLILAALLPVIVVTGCLSAGERAATALTMTGLLVLMSTLVIVVLVRTSKQRLWCTAAGAERLATMRRDPSAALPGIDPVQAGVALLGVGQLSDPALEAALVGRGSSAIGGLVGTGATCGGDGGGGSCGEGSCGGGGGCGGN
ncbi:TIGR04222 domain-containing membrane protein [Streptomyces sp. NPDC006514]|uniref:TIGR04222 domain-containing membrane protein n=1 Tax=Streptomyces sp. NPDC006514 TaxID=3154308 RepID=UPI0033B4618B